MSNLYAYVSCIAIAITISVTMAADAGIQFNREFAPQLGLTMPQERPYRDEICLNGMWQFQPIGMPEGYKAGSGAPELPLPVPDAWEKTRIRIPSPWNVNSFSEGDGGDFRCFPDYPKSWEKVEMGWLMKTFKVPSNWKGKRIFIDFEGIAGDARVLVNGMEAGRQFDIFLPLRLDITSLVKWDSENTLLVGVKKPSLFDIPGRYGRFTYPTGSFWGMHIAGIWQDVYLQCEPMIRIADAFVKPMVDKDMLQIEISLKNHLPNDRWVQIGANVRAMVINPRNDMLTAPIPSTAMSDTHLLELTPKKVNVRSGAGTTVTLSSQVLNRLKLWSPNSPNLYGAIIELKADDKVIDRKFVRFGWRQFTISGRSLMLNGKPIEARGDAWHFMGVPQMTRRYAWAWCKALKDANANAVRFHAQVYPRFYLDVADEMGIMVLDESAIWASHCGFNYDEPIIWERFKSHAENLVLRDRNHPSVFGWSVANEINAALGVVKAPPETIAQIDDQIASIVQSMYDLDPTRPWISSDGDEDMGGRLKVVIGHYGDIEYFKRLSQAGKPFGIGEASSAYYATPAEVSKFNGERAYESFEGRMEGIAIESYELLTGQRKNKAAYSSVFNMAWYGLKPLQIGQNDVKRPPKLTDGIFFGEYMEGKPGMQPERLGPYCTTFNPGYDPNLPLYDPWPMFDAIKAAFAPVPQHCPWDHRRQDEPRSNEAAPTPTINEVGFIGDRNGKASFSLIRAGVNLIQGGSKNEGLLIVDGQTVTAQEIPMVRNMISSLVKKGGTAIIWGVDKQRLRLINSILPESILITDRSAVSLVPHKDAITANMRLSDLYFAEQPFGSVVMPYGLDGQFVRKGRVLLEASNTDWRKWNGQPENIKTAAVLRSERETKPSGAAFVLMEQGDGQVIVSSLDLSAVTPKHTHMIRTLMQNLGVKLSEPAAMAGDVFDSSGALKRALVVGSFGAESHRAAFDTDFINGEESDAIKPKANDKIGDMTWQIKEADEKMIMDFRKMGLPGPIMNCAAYVSFWIYSPRPLDQLLAQPDVPRVDIIMGADDGVKLWLNGKLLMEDFAEHPLDVGQYSLSALPLKQGWNHFLIKVSQGWGEWQLTMRLQCADPIFLASMRSAVECPE